MSTEKFNIVIPHYAQHFKLSEKRMREYYYPGDKVPLYVQKKIDNLSYDLDPIKGCYRDVVSGEFIVKNKNTAGKPRLEKINGQKIWDGSVAQFTRNKMKDFLSSYFTPFIARQLPPKIFPPSKDHYIQLEYIYFIPFDKTPFLQDYLNHSYPYQKIFEDTLTKMEVIIDDDPYHVRGGYARLVDIEDETERRMEVKFHFCKNDERIS